MLCFGAVPLQALMPCGQVSACPAPSLCPLHFLHSCAVFSLPPSSSFLLASFSFFRTFLRLSFQVLVINFYFVKGFCCTRFCIFTESDWLLFSFSKIRFLFSTLFSSHHVQSLFWFWHHQYQMYKRFLLTNTRYI